ncbi:DinB family protein [Larkinella harenae]
MPTFETRSLLGQLQTETRKLVRIVEQEFKMLSDEALNRPPAPNRWSVAQCLEHLNSYGAYYLPLLEAEIKRAETHSKAALPHFRSSWLGNYFAKSMQPNADGSIGLKMKAFKNHTPAPVLDARTVLTDFLKQQDDLLNLLERAERVNIQSPRVPISIARFIRLSVGDTFRFLLAHEQRHVLQAQRVVAEAKLCSNSSVQL